MFRLIRKILFRFILVLLMLVVVLLVTVNLPFDFYRHETSGTDYSGWMGENLQAGEKVIDIAMLGAHDAFTSQISYASQTDLLSASSIQTGFTGALIRGFSVKQSKTQVSSVAVLLAAGVRYFDIRLTYNEKEAAWYTSHTYFSDDFETVLSSIAEFLAAHPGEFLILDIQHVNGIDYAVPAENDPAFAEIRDLFASTGVLGYAYEERTKVLSEITYGDMTQNESQAGVLIFTKLQNEEDAFWSYGAAIRSAWPNTDSEETAFEFLTAEADLIVGGEALTGNQMADNPEATDAREGLRVMQGVLTMQMSGEGILGAILDWSLLTKARGFNSNLLDQAEFPDWLAAMPIVMVDYADTNFENFNDRIMEIILESNGNG